jgi:hypothetical protein
MIVHAKKVVALGVMALGVAVISLPVDALAAAPTVSVQSPVVKDLGAPVKIALDVNGNIYVADQRAGGVIKFDTFGIRQMVIRTAAPSGLAFANDGSLLVSQGAFVARYDVATGQEVGRLSGGNLQSAAGIAVDDVTGYIYVADSRANQIEMYNASGEYAKAFGRGFSADANGLTVKNPVGMLSMPTGITFEKISRRLAVSDTLGSRVQFFDVNGNYANLSVGDVIPGDAATIYTKAISSMQFVAPVATAFEYKSGLLDRMYVLDAFQSNVRVIDMAAATPVALSVVGAAGVANGQLMTPTDVAFDAKNNRLLVVNGFGNITIYGIDGGKNPVYVDVTPPTFTVNAVPAEVTVNSLLVGGSVEAGSSIQLAAGGTATVGVIAYSGSSWSAQVAGLVVGANSISVTAKDSAGNVALPKVVNVNYVLAGPAVAISPLNSVTRSSKIAVSGTVDSGAAVIVTNKTTSSNINAIVSGSTWNCDVDLADGVNNLSVSAKKPQSATSVAAVDVTLDSVAPLLNVSALSNGSYASTQVQNVSGTVSDLSGVSVVVNGKPAVLFGNAFSVPVELVAGVNKISVVAVDAAGNTSVDNRVISYDAAKPIISIQSPFDNSYTSNNVLTIKGSVDKPSIVTVAGVPVVVESGVWSAVVDLLAGVNTVEVVATDLYGNSSSEKRSITFDNVKPSLAITSPAQDVAVNAPNTSISGVVTGVSAVALEYTVNGNTVAVPVDSTGHYSFNVDFVAEGSYPIALTAKDPAGNSSTVVRTVLYDMTPPVLTLDQVSGVMPEKISGTVESGSSVAVYEADVKKGSVQIVDGNWNADLAGITYNSDDIKVVATDAAGNSSSKTLVYNFPDGAAINDNGKPTVADALRAIRIVVNQLVPTAKELAHYDIGPLVNGKPNPNGKIELVDAILILRKSLGLKSW